VNGFFFVIELIFVAANATKLIEGGWFPLILACTIAFVMLTAHWLAVARTGAFQAAPARGGVHRVGHHHAGETMAELEREYECGEATIWRALQ
jgi:hypothetical protein